MIRKLFYQKLLKEYNDLIDLMIVISEDAARNKYSEDELLAVNETLKNLNIMIAAVSEAQEIQDNDHSKVIIGLSEDLKEEVRKMIKQ